MNNCLRYNETVFRQHGASDAANREFENAAFHRIFIANCHCPQHVKQRLCNCRASVCPSVRLSACLPACLSVCAVRPPHAAGAGLQLWARRPCGRYQSIAARPAVSISRAAARHAAANAGSATLSAVVWEAKHRLISFRVNL